VIVNFSGNTAGTIYNMGEAEGNVPADVIACAPIGTVGYVDGTLGSMTLDTSKIMAVSLIIDNFPAISGGGGGGYWSTPGNAGPGIGGIGGGTSGEVDALPVSSPANTGGGAGGNGAVNGTDPGGNGGSGVVILRMPTANFSGTYTGNPVVTALGSDTILIYKNSGTYTV